MATITKQEAERLAERFARSCGVYSADFSAPDWVIAAIVAAASGEFSDRRLDRTITVAQPESSGPALETNHFALDVEI